MGKLKYWICKLADVCVETEYCPVKGVHISRAGSECHHASSRHKEKRPMREATLEETAAAMLTGELERTLEREAFDLHDGEGRRARQWEGYND